MNFLTKEPINKGWSNDKKYCITDKTRIKKRNSAILAEKTSAYYVDDNLAAKFRDLFEKPSKEEIDVWVKQ